jgi:hypothetical protein
LRNSFEHDLYKETLYWSDAGIIYWSEHVQMYSGPTLTF